MISLCQNIVEVRFLPRNATHSVYYAVVCPSVRHRLTVSHTPALWRNGHSYASCLETISAVVIMKNAQLVLSNFKTFNVVNSV